MPWVGGRAFANEMHMSPAGPRNCRDPVCNGEPESAYEFVETSPDTTLSYGRRTAAANDRGWHMVPTSPRFSYSRIVLHI